MRYDPYRKHAISWKERSLRKIRLWSPSLGRSGKLNTLPPPKEKKTATVGQNTCLLPYLPVLYSYSISVEGQYSVPFFVQEGEEKETHTHTQRERERG